MLNGGVHPITIPISFILRTRRVASNFLNTFDIYISTIALSSKLKVVKITPSFTQIVLSVKHILVQVPRQEYSALQGM
jgi:hypothetical protein